MSDDNLTLQRLGDNEVVVPLVEDGGSLKDNALDHLGTVTRTGYSVIFQRVYEVNGSMDPHSKDNATLLVLKIMPYTKEQKQQFKGFEVSLKVKTHTKPPGMWRNVGPPQIIAYEPAQEGALYIKETIIPRTEASSLGGNASVQPATGLSLGFTASKSVTEEIKKRVLHRVSARPHYGSNSSKHPDKITWTISPAEDADGIGDYMVAAMLISRAKGSSFIIEVGTDAGLGLLHDAANHFPGRAKLALGPFPTELEPGEKKSTVPPGVEENSLEAISSENLLQTFSFVHIPEKTLAREIYRKTTATLETMTIEEGGETSLPDQAPLVAPATGPELLKGKPMAAETPARLNRVVRLPGVKMAQTTGRPVATSSARAIRLRKVAAHYQRLAQLYREEADEADGLDESYTLAAEEEEYD
ncbi:hypothetical protein F5Y19DRAFT_198669 [Xylariaceae sp. FL1651]|nr:hypothetical protein F5Y19DRAFT_198669 [Xylariaceae sp. FL1651]